MNYLAIERTSVSNGIGIRCVLWVSGCHHKCKGCQNKSSWDFNAGKVFGREELDYIIDYLQDEKVDGITFSGGDPLAPENIDAVCYIAKTIKDRYRNSKTIWCYTGYTFDEIKDKEVMKYIDVIVDGEYVEEERDLTLAFRGSRNQCIIEVKNG